MRFEWAAAIEASHFRSEEHCAQAERLRVHEKLANALGKDDAEQAEQD
jgi:hypothetical protein